MKWSWRERPRTVPRPRATAAGLWVSHSLNLLVLSLMRCPQVDIVAADRDPARHRHAG